MARNTGEEVRFIDVSNWRVVDINQDLLTGYVLRTNANGQLAIVFSDHIKKINDIFYDQIKISDQKADYIFTFMLAFL
ncbi:hypothetical protein ACC687_41745, partial [Rhizobium ruizarguesonis]